MSLTRVVVAARLSRVQNGEQGRIDRDDSDAQRWAESRDDVEIVAVSEDAGVSGATSPFNRPSLGPWLTQPARLVQYDEIVASSLDRLGRNARDLQELRNWADANGKTLRVLKPDLTWPVPEGLAGMPSKIMWELLGILAEAELEATKERSATARKALLADGAFYGKPPWGFEVLGDKFKKTLAPDPALVPYMRGMVDRAMKGDTYLSIARWLNAEGVPAGNGGKWATTSVGNVLRNPALMGRRYENGKVVLRFDSILSAAEFSALQAEFEKRPKKRGPNGDKTAMLTGVLICQKCGSPMYRHHSKTKRKDGTCSLYTVYRCKGPDTSPSTCGNAITAEDIEGWVSEWFTEAGTFARTEIVETILVPGDDHVGEIAEVEADLRDLDFDALDYDEQHAALRRERSRLRSLPSEPAQVIEHPTGRTVGEGWHPLDDQQRRRFLLSAGIQVVCFSNAVREQGGGYRQGTGSIIPGHPGLLPFRLVLPPAEGFAERPGEQLYVTGDPSRIRGALANLTD